MDYAPFLQELILAAGARSLLFRQDLERLSVSEKNGSVRDLVSEADEAIERQIRQQIRTHFPQHRIVGEELAADCQGTDELCWFVDPIDGTVNFVKGSPFYSISIALLRGEEILCGGVLAPALGEFYSAAKNQGAFSQKVLWPATNTLGADFQPGTESPFILSKKRMLRVRPLSQLAQAVMITGFGCLRAGIQPNNYLYLGHILPHISDVRRQGSAALDLCYVASGIFDGYWEIGLNLYDIAAGCLILEQAGGCYSDMYGTMADFPSSVLAASPVIYRQALEIFARVEKPYNGFRSLLQS